MIMILMLELTKGCAELGIAREDCNVEVLERAKKGLFGKIKTGAKVRVYVEEEESKLMLAKVYLMDVLEQLGIENANLLVEEKEDFAIINIEGDNLGTIIGRRGETLDALQYLTSLVCNRAKGDYYKITLDCCNYRSKREETLRELAVKISKQVIKTGRNSVLEPMNPYERRIIHAVISEIEGVSSKSVGEDPNRKVVIMSTNPKKPNQGRGGRGGRGRDDRNRRRNDSDKPAEQSEEKAEHISDEEYLEKCWATAHCIPKLNYKYNGAQGIMLWAPSIPSIMLGFKSR